MNIILNLSHGPNEVYVHADNIYSFTKSMPYTHWFEPNKEYTLSFYDSMSLTNKLMTCTIKIQNDNLTCLNIDGDTTRCQRNMPPGLMIGTNYATGYKQIGFFVQTATTNTKTVRFTSHNTGNFYVHESNIINFTNKLSFLKDVPINTNYTFEVYNTQTITGATPILTCDIYISKDSIVCNTVNGSSTLCNKQSSPGINITDNDTIHFYLPSSIPTNTPEPTPTPDPSIKTKNVALSSNGATATAQTRPSDMINSITNKYTNTSGFTASSLNTPIIITFDNTYQIGEVRILFWDLDNRYTHYTIETSTDNINWDPYITKNYGTPKKWDITVTGNKPLVKYMRITGTYCSIGTEIRIVEFEAWTVPTYVDKFPVMFTRRSGPLQPVVHGLDFWKPITLSAQHFLFKNKTYNLDINTTINLNDSPILMTVVLQTTDDNISCVSVNKDSSLCQKNKSPSIIISTNVYTNYKEIEFYIPESVTPQTFNSYNEWFIYHEGDTGSLLHNLIALLEMVDAYMKWKDLGFTVTLINLLDSVDYYLGFK